MDEEIKNEEKQPAKKMTFAKLKKISILILIVVALGFCVYGFFWFRSTQKMRAESQAVIAEAEQYNVLRDKVNAEKSRCEVFISQKEGDFGSFEYCQKYIDWSKDILN